MTPTTLATSSYSSRDLIIASGLMPVGISIGEPKFPLAYECVYMRRLAPWGLREIVDNDEFAERYRARLEGLGIVAVAKRFAEISAEHSDRGLLLLCFEAPGSFCHRRVLAEWWEEQTGEHVPELADDQLGLF
jgi:hypothetical protein